MLQSGVVCQGLHVVRCVLEGFALEDRVAVVVAENEFVFGMENHVGCVSVSVCVWVQVVEHVRVGVAVPAQVVESVVLCIEKV